ncbi:MAG: hypothetical protein MJE77_37270 [Proteobacteria bacterium]|nr:hypothetical protein [Pseudomonadota bacterium]
MKPQCNSHESSVLCGSVECSPVRGLGWKQGSVLVCVLASVVGSTGCGDSTEDPPSNNPSAQGPLYAVTSRIFNSDFSDTTSFVWLIDDLDSGRLDTAEAIELPGGASIWGVAEAGVFYVVSAEELTLTKLEIEEGRPKEAGRIGLTGQGVTFLLSERMVFDGPDRAFLLDLNSAQALELDLAQMEIARTVDLSTVLLGSAELNFLAETKFRQHGDRLVTSIYGTSTDYGSVAVESNLLFFDPAAGTFTVDSAPCGGLNYSVLAPNGDIYFASDTYVASVHLITAEGSPPPCMVRLARDSRQADSTFVSMNDVLGGPAGGLIPGSDGSAYVRVLDANLYSPGPGSTYQEAFSAAAWQTWRLDLDDPMSAERIDREPLAGGIKVFEVDGHGYENESTANFSSTTLIRTTGSNAPVRGLEMPGTTWGIVRVR